MLGETQEAIRQQESQTPEPVAIEEATQHVEISLPQQITLQDVMDRLAGLEEQQRLNPTPGVAAEIRQLRQAVEQLHRDVSHRREGTQTPTRDVAHRDGSVASHLSSSDTSTSSHHSSICPSHATEAAIQTQPTLSHEYLSRSDSFLVTNETQTDNQRRLPMVSRLRQPQVYGHSTKLPDMSGRVSLSSISTNQSEQSDVASRSHTHIQSEEPHSRSQSSDERHRRRLPNRHTHTSDSQSDQYDANMSPLVPHPHDTQPTSQSHTKSQTETEQQTVGVQASPYVPQPSRIPRLSSHWKKLLSRPGLGDSFDRDSGFVGSSVQPKDEQQRATTSTTHSSVSTQAENVEEESDPASETEMVQPRVTRYEYVQQPPVFLPSQFPGQYFGYPGVGDRDGGEQREKRPQPVVQTDPSMSNAVNGLRDELQRLQEQMDTLRALQQPPTKTEQQQQQQQTDPTTAKTTTAIQTDDTRDTTDRPTEHHPRPHLPIEPTHLPFHPQLASLSSDVEQPRHRTTEPVEHKPYYDTRKSHRHPKASKQSGRQTRQQRRSHESEMHDSESDLPRLLNSHRTQTPATWRSTDMEKTPQKSKLAKAPAFRLVSVSSLSRSDSDSNMSSVAVEMNTDEFECPMCGGSGTFVTPSGERRHHHEKKKRSKGTQTMESYLVDSWVDEGQQTSELPEQRKHLRNTTVRTAPLVVDIRRDPSPIQRDRVSGRRSRTQPVAVREGGTRIHHVTKSDGEHENERLRTARSLVDEFESESDGSGTPRVTLKRRPQAESTPYVYYSDESSSSDGSHVVVTEKQRKRDLVIVDETDEPDRVVIHKKPKRRNSVHVVRERSPTTTHIVRERSPTRTHIVRERSPTRTHIVRERSPTRTHIVRERSPTRTHIVRERSPMRTHIVRTSMPTTVVRESSPRVTHIVRDRRPSTTHITSERPTSRTHIVRERESPITHIVRDREPSSMYVVRERPSSSVHIVRERPSTTTHIVRERPSSSHVVLRDDDDDDDDNDVEVLLERNRVRRATPLRRRSRRAMSSAGDVVETDDIEMALRRVKRETRRVSHRSRDILHNMSTELNSKGVF
ncbi:uncharacterized protein LOC134191184 isoform X2 [Corticium candelabrum]|nr:uncharacterized protein LOC134191184 isoform X2 [Corticium candelabrum]XP_062515751.1 uncharacterized protein LOC134191184 isoform X2 [Corticium candelabrum]XP_062515752.1 uncharacterized protein LOC134191184 isoform X2 [Corticium candelabrum]